MTQYQATPDYYRDYIEHGWAKDAAAKVHKYIKRWKNAAGKWIYQYKENAKKPESHPSYANWNTQRDWRAEGLYGNQHHQTEARGALLTRYQDIQRAKQRAKLNAKNKKVRKGTGYSGSSSRHKNLTQRGYSRAEGNILMRGSNLYNKSTRRPPSHLEVEKYLKNDGKNGPSIVFKESKRVYDNYGTGTNNYLYRKQRNKTAAERARKNRKAK